MGGCLVGVEQDHQQEADVMGGFWKGASKLQAHVGSWTLTPDPDTESPSESHGQVTYTGTRAPYIQPLQHVAPCIIMSQGNGLRPSELPRQRYIPRHVLVPLPALGPMPVPTLVVPGSSTVLRNSSLSHVSR